MKAAVCYGNGLVKYEEIQEPKTKENEVKVKIKACGICGSDIPRALKSSAHYYPIVLGHEAAGEIVELVVLPESRGRKIGGQLLQAIEAKANELRLEQIELSTSTYRKQAHHFYESNDYEMLHYNYTKNL